MPNAKHPTRGVGLRPGRIAGDNVDSRALQSGDLFFALRAESFDRNARPGIGVRVGQTPRSARDPLVAQLPPIASTLTTGCGIDTRTLQPGDFFFSRRGESFEGNAYLEQAVRVARDPLVAHLLQ